MNTTTYQPQRDLAKMAVQFETDLWQLDINHSEYNHRAHLVLRFTSDYGVSVTCNRKYGGNVQFFAVAMIEFASERAAQQPGGWALCDNFLDAADLYSIEGVKSFADKVKALALEIDHAIEYGDN